MKITQPGNLYSPATPSLAPPSPEMNRAWSSKEVCLFRFLIYCLGASTFPQFRTASAHQETPPPYRRPFSPNLKLRAPQAGPQRSRKRSALLAALNGEGQQSPGPRSSRRLEIPPIRIRYGQLHQVGLEHCSPVTRPRALIGSNHAYNPLGSPQRLRTRRFAQLNPLHLGALRPMW